MAPNGAVTDVFAKKYMQYTLLDVPGPSFTYANDINNKDIVVGEYRDSSRNRYGFLYDGTNYITLHVSGVTRTSAFGINNKNVLAGEYEDSSGEGR